MVVPSAHQRLTSRARIAHATAMLVLLTLLALLRLLAGDGLPKGRSWSRAFARGPGVIALGAFPIGTVNSHHAFCVLLESSATERFPV